MTRRLTLARYAETTGRHPHDAEHARREAECPTCKETRTFYASIAPDPQRRAQVRVEREAQGWLSCHPCYASTAHPRRMFRGVAA